MMNTSIGYHTLTIFKTLTFAEARSLKKAFYRYRDNTGEIRIRPIQPDTPDDTGDPFDKILYSGSPRYLVIEYIGKTKGIRWILRFSNSSPKFINGRVEEARPCSIKATINPKVFVGNINYISAANEYYLTGVEESFNSEAQRISPLLDGFSSYGLNRNDYCINFDLNELNIGCTPMQMMQLIKRADIPTHFSEWTEYDAVSSHRRKSKDYCFYPKCNSVTINCYYKYRELLEDFSDCLDIEESKHVIRFEVQCRYLKVYNMMKVIKHKDYNANIIREMLSDDISLDIISKYFNHTIHGGNYYTLDMARKIIQSKRFSSKKEHRLIDALNKVTALIRPDWTFAPMNQRISGEL